MTVKLKSVKIWQRNWKQKKKKQGFGESATNTLDSLNNKWRSPQRSFWTIKTDKKNDKKKAIKMFLGLSHEKREVRKFRNNWKIQGEKSIGMPREKYLNRLINNHGKRRNMNWLEPLKITQDGNAWLPMLPGMASNVHMQNMLHCSEIPLAKCTKFQIIND